MFFNVLFMVFTIASANEIELLKKEFFEMKKVVADLRMKLDSYQEFCKLLPDNICGHCLCKDDDRIFKKYYCDCQNLDPKRDCLEFKRYGNSISGIYKIHLNNMKTTQVYCDQDTDGGGWTVIQRRTDGSVNFQRDWLNYKHGFGQLQNEFWLGNEIMYLISLQGSYPRGNELRIELKNSKGIKKFAKYKEFEIGSSLANYRLQLKGFSGTASDSLSHHNGLKFTTYDNDNDSHDGNCAQVFTGGWWYSQDCFSAHLNGIYYPGGKITGNGWTGIHWGNDAFNNHGNSPLLFSEMKVRRNL